MATIAREDTPGSRLRNAVIQEKPLQIAGALNGNAALLAERAGFRALYLSGGGVAAGSLGIPDLGITTLEDVIVDLQRITRVTSLPVLVDADTGFGPSAFNIARTVREMIAAGAGGLHIEDQIGAKRCGHRPGKEIVTKDEMVDRLKAAVNVRNEVDPSFVIMARTDALANEGLNKAIDRAQAFVAAGADMIFPDAVTTLDEFRAFTSAVKVPVLANLTEFGRTPLFTKKQLAAVGIKIILYPLSAFRASCRAAERVYKEIRKKGTQAGVLDSMQTRNELYDMISYHKYEKELDDMFAASKDKKKKAEIEPEQIVLMELNN